MRTVKGKVTWVDILKPNEADLAAIKKLHNFHPIILDELLHPSPRIRIEHFESYLFIVYHFPEYNTELKTSQRTELDILITKDKIITIHYDNIPELNAFFDQLSNDETERKRILGSDSLLPMYQIFERAISFSLRQLRHIEERVSFVGQEIFNTKGVELLKKISYVKRDILDYRLITHPQEKFFLTLHEIGLNFWGPKSRVYLSDLVNDNIPVHRNLDNYFETIESLETTNAQLLDAETNATIKSFTIGAFLVSIPLYFVFFNEFTYIHDIFASTPTRFWTSFVVIHAGILAVWIYFRKRKIV